LFVCLFVGWLVGHCFHRDKDYRRISIQVLEVLPY
jgi:hypothetical protein